MIQLKNIKHILLPISPGEAMDKACILYIKKQKITDPEKLANVEHEHEELIAVMSPMIAAWEASNVEVADFWLIGVGEQLVDINEQLWDVEDALRQKEKHLEFDNDFVELARSVYKLNDERSRIKRSINKAMGASIIEEKDHVEYE